ncbi:MAG: hypothetical protein MUF31_12525 [Akkermansiaceae bacterium]|nr:hypothetical protein [Akkermansiaceae bacterium]
MKTETLRPLLGIALLAGASHAQVVYVDATSGPTGNTRLASGADFTPPLNGTTGADNNWEQRTVYGSSGNIFEAGGEAIENAQELVTKITGLTPNASYQVRVHFWDAGGTVPVWSIRAGLTSNPGANPVYVNPGDVAGIAGSVAGVLASSLTYTTAPTVFVQDDRTMYAASVATAIANSSGEISVFIDDLPSPIGANRRTWLDGVSYELLPDSDGDTLPNAWETANNLDPNDATGANGASGNPDNDGLTNFQEYALSRTNPNLADTDGDTVQDGAEFTGSGNAFNGSPTNPLLADSDGDGANDAAENIYPTNPNAADTDADGMPDGYELLCQNPGTALDPTTNDSSADNDSDGLSNIAEFDPTLGPNSQSVRTRADLADTDADGLSDSAEDNFGSWGGVTATGTNPTRPDTDGDGLTDSQENFSLTSYQGAGVKPAWCDPTFADTDGDGFEDGFEVNTASTDPNDDTSVPTQPAGFTLLENFESGTIGQTFKGTNGWTSPSANDAMLVFDEPIAGGDKVGGFVRPAGAGNHLIYKSLRDLGLHILEGNTGTLFLQIHASGSGLDHSLGLTDVETPGWFTDFEAQTALLGATPTLGVRANSGFRAYTGGGYRTGRWMNVWIVCDTAANTTKVYYQSPNGETGVVDITADSTTTPYLFRNGASANALTTFMMIENAALAPIVYLDNLYIDPTSANLSLPAALKPEPSANPSIVSVFFDGPNLKIRFAPGGSGYVLTSSNDLASPFQVETNATFDGVDTFTVPSSSLNPGKDFFRVETP